MDTHRHIINLLIEFTENVGDAIGIQFRSGTDQFSKAYDTNKSARIALFKVLDTFQPEVINLAKLAEQNGANNLRSELKTLLNIEDPE